MQGSVAITQRRRGRHRRDDRRKLRKVGKLALMGASTATAASIALTPAVAEAATIQTLTVGLPLGITIPNTTALPTDPQAINNALVAIHDPEPIVISVPNPAWLWPQWWNNPVALANGTSYLTDANVIAYGQGAFATAQAYRAMLESADGATRPGYDPVQGAGPRLNDPAELEIVRRHQTKVYRRRST